MYLFVFLTSIVAGTLSGVIGTGSSLILLPILVEAYGPKEAIPIMAVAAVIGNLSRVVIWWRRVDWRAAAGYALFGAPAAALGASTMLALPVWVVDFFLGLFFWGMVPLGRRLKKTQKRLSVLQLSLCGAPIGFLTGLVLSTGPLSVPAFISYGLSGGAFIGTEAASAMLLYVSKIGTFSVQNALPGPIVLQGVLVGAGLMIGTVGSKPLVLKLSPQTFSLLIDLLLFFSGASLFRSAYLSA